MAHTNGTKILLVNGLAVGLMGSISVQAEESNSTESIGKVEKIVVTGSRKSSSDPESSAAPVDFVFGDDLFQQGDTDLPNLMRNVVPSYNVNNQPISDAATIVRPANLRGLPPDSTLVLVNGKRRHRSAVISFLGQGVSDGSQGADISVIPSIALKRVEVLKDGAAAQYGSDAIAGVVNFVLKDDAQGATFSTKLGSYYEGDGQLAEYAANIGMPLFKNGFANVSFEYGTSESTNRSVQRADAAALIEAGNTNVADPAQIWGQPEVTDNIKAFVNLGQEINDNLEFYALGNYAQRRVEGGFYYRNPDTRDGVYSNDGGETRLVGDRNPNNDIACDQIAVGDAAGLALITDNNSALGAECFTFTEMFPGGFTPRFGGNLVDTSGVAGFRGELEGAAVPPLNNASMAAA